MSPIVERVIAEKASPFNWVVVTELPQGLRTMRFGVNGVRQGAAKPDDPNHLELTYTKLVAPCMAFLDRHPARLLAIGLGSGAVPRYLNHHFPDTQIDVVEVDPVVVEMARDYFGFRENANLRVHIADGRRYLEECRAVYDLLILDAFGGHGTSRHLTTREFLCQAGHSLRPGGGVISHVWSRRANPLYDRMVATHQHVLDPLYVISVPGLGGRMLVAVPGGRMLTTADLLERVIKLDKEVGLRFEDIDCLAKGRWITTDSVAGLPLLRDD